MSWRIVPSCGWSMFPADDEVQEEAFSGCHPDLEIVRGDYTGFHNVTL